MFRCAVAIVLAIVLALAIAAVPARTVPSASAHAELVRSTPPSEGLLAVPPRRLDLWFSEGVAASEGSLTIRMLDQEGQDLPLSNVRIDPDDAGHVLADVGRLAPGTATVVWSVRSATDGHTLTGSYAFRVGAGRAPGAATVEGETPRLWAVATRWLTFLGIALLAGGFAFAVLVLQPGDDHAAGARRRARLAIVGGGGALLATVLEPALQTRWPPSGALAPSFADAVAGLPRAWWFRPAALVPALACAVVASRASLRGGAIPRIVVWVGLGAALAALLGLSLTSHAATRENWRLPAVASNVLHQWSVALWVGGLAQLALWWSGWRGLERGAAPGIAADRPVRRFSRLALGLVAVGVGTGAANAGLVLPTVRSLWTSDYGGVLLVKVGALTVPLALATFNRRALRNALGEVQGGLRRAIRAEAAVVLAVVLAGSVLALLAPPVVRADRPTVADVPMPAFGAYRGQDLLVHLTFAPGTPGKNTVGVWLSNYDRTPFAGEPPALVRLRFLGLDVPTETDPIDAQLTADGRWATTTTGLSLTGWWRVEATLRWLGESDVVVPFVLMLPDPNLNGLDAPEIPPNDDQAAELYARAMAVYTGMHRVRFAQAMASHTGTVGYAVHAVNDGSDGSTPGFTYDAPGGWNYVALGTTSWSRTPGEPWQVSETNPMIPPSEWDEEYVGATGFRLGRVEEVGGESCQVLTFVVPGTRKQVVAWYVWWVGTETGRVHREMMVSQSHYMLSTFSDFDAPIVISPPEQTPELPGATPIRT